MDDPPFPPARPRAAATLVATPGARSASARLFEIRVILRAATQPVARSILRHLGPEMRQRGATRAKPVWTSVDPVSSGKGADPIITMREGPRSGTSSCRRPSPKEKTTACDGGHYPSWARTRTLLIHGDRSNRPNPGRLPPFTRVRVPRCWSLLSFMLDFAVLYLLKCRVCVTLVPPLFLAPRAIANAIGRRARRLC